MMKIKGGIFILWVGLVIWGMPAATAHACGGLFCQNTPVDQNAERIIFTQNGDGTTSAIIEIQFTGFAPDFSWILPIPNPIAAEDIAVPETAEDAFIELQNLTDPIIVPPPIPDCVREVAMSVLEDSSEGGVNVFASGEVGPYGFDVIGSSDPNALINWLRENKYRVTEPMEPLINVYVEEGFYFLAMRLLPNEQADSIQPIQVTYETDTPMIPLRLTAVAANPNMGIYVWFFADQQATPSNYAAFEVKDEEITFFDFGGNDYLQLIGQKADEFGGQGFITEYAAPSHELGFSDPLLVELANKHPYLTRVYTQISPEEMTLDPTFQYDAQLKDVSNRRDLSNMKGLYQCERENSLSNRINLPFIGDDGGTAGNSSTSSESSPNNLGLGIIVGSLGVLALIGLLGIGIILGRRSKS